MSEFGNVAFDPETLAILEGLMARSAAPKRTRNATASKKLSKKVSGKPFPLQMLLLL
jgi:hypothetical protein